MKSKVPNDEYRDDPDAVPLNPTSHDVPYTDDEFNDQGTSSSAPPTYDETTFYNDPEHGKYPSAGLNDRDCHFSGTTQNLFRRRGTTQVAGHVPISYPPADTDPKFLEAWVRYMARQAPSPYIVAIGTHKEWRRDNDGKQKREEITDFRICINLRDYLWPNFRTCDPSMMELRTVDNGTKTWRGTIFKHRAPGWKGVDETRDERENKPDLREWCHLYCASAFPTRIFRLTRSVVGFDNDHIANRLTGIIRATNYKGHLNITFPVGDRAVDIYSDSFVNRWRLKTWVRWLFYLTFLWIPTWPILYFTTKRYNIVKAEWAFSRVEAHGVRRYSTFTEEQWIEKYGPAIKQLAWDRFDGVAGDEMLKQVLSRPETYQPFAAEFRGARAAIGATVGLFSGDSNRAHHVNNVLRFAAGAGGDETGWGYDT